MQNLAPLANKDEAVLTKATFRAAERLGLSQSLLATVLGISPASVSRMRDGRYVLRQDQKEFELGAWLVRVYRSLDAITGGDARVTAQWMKTPNTGLHGTPAEMITTIAGLADVVAYLDMSR